METFITPVKKTVINPWAWQDKLGNAQVPGFASTLYCSGQANGNPSGGSMNDQIHESFNNLEKVLRQAGYTLSDVVRLIFYTTSIDDFFCEYGAVLSRLKKFNGVPSSTLTEVRALAYPSLLLEIEATAAR
ncbi:MAG: RidA family protein [Agriterribacter sp.]